MGYVEAGEAAWMLGVSHRAVRNVAGRRRLEVRRKGEDAPARLLISLASVEQLRSKRRAAGKNPRG